MTWKKLAFYDEVMLADGSVPMTDDLDMGGNMIGNIWGLRGTLSTNVLSVYGGVSNADAVVEISGKDAAGYDGDIVFRVPNAAKTSGVNALTINGASDTPIVDIKHGLDMNDKQIASINSLKAHDTLGIGVFDSGDSDRIVLCPTGYGFLANSPVDMNKQEIEAMCFENLASAPASPGAAQIYYDTVDDHLYVNVV